MSNSDEIKEIAEAMREAMAGHPAPTIMSALMLVVADTLSRCDMTEGNDINSAMATFDKQVRALYAMMVEDMRS